MIVVLCGVSTAINLLPPMLNRYLVDEVLIPKEARWLPWIVLGLFGARLVDIFVVVSYGAGLGLVG